MKKTLTLLLSAALVIGTLTGCTASPNISGTSSFDVSKDIGIVSREDGSGTRTAFIELFGIEVKNDDGSKKDRTTKEAVIAKQTDVMMTNIAGDLYAIGYISLGSLNATVKALDIEGAQATPGNVKSGAYTISRPFFVATKGAPSPLAADFIGFILSKEGQDVVSSSKYITVGEAPAAYAGSKSAGKLVVAGSSSVTPVMEKLKEAYSAFNPNANIEIQQSDSSAGMKAAIEGTCDIGMSSRALKDSELENLSPTQIALDGIAVIVNNGNPMTSMTKDQVKSIFTGESLVWNEVVQ